MIFILLIVSILIYEFLHRFHEFTQGSKCISMLSFKDKNYLVRFDEIYDEVLKENETELIGVKKKCKAVFLFKIISYVCGFWIFLCGILILFNKSISTGLLIVGISMFVIAAAVYSEKYANLYFAEYLEKYKDKIINNYIRKINKGFGYSLRGCIEEKLFKETFSNDIEINHYYGCDYITGTVEGKRTLNLCELYVKYLDISNKKNIFCGLFGYLKTDYEKEMIVECVNGKINYKNIPLNMQVTIEKFIKDFKKNNKVDFNVLVKNGKIFVKFYTGDLLKPAVFSKKTNKERLWAYYLLLKFMVDLSSLINESKVY